MRNAYIWISLIIMILMGCRSTSKKQVEQIKTKNVSAEGLVLPAGFKATIVVDNLGRGRHLVVNDNRDIYMALNKLENEKGIVALRDIDGDGKADLIRYFGSMPGTGIDIYNGYLYFGSDISVVRYKLIPGELIPDTVPELVIDGFPEQDTHESKAITIDPLGNLYVNVGGPSNACMEKTRTFGSMGIDPCPQLDQQAGIWQYSANRKGQKHTEDGIRYATGIRNAIALKWNTISDNLYAVQHGRDQLAQLFPEIFDENEGVNLPAEEFLLIEKGDDFGWPYCYYDPFLVKKVLAPEYGGNGTIVGRCEKAKDPILAFPAHIAPNSLLFYDKDMFPEKYHNGAFVAFHGSWNRAPQVQEGYFVAFVPFDGILPTGQWEIFANGFAVKENIKSPREAVHRPTGLALGPDGALYVSDSQRGKIWKIEYMDLSKEQK